VLAGTGQITNFRIRIGFSVGQPVDPQPGDAIQFVGFVLFERDVVFGHAGHHACAAPGTLIQIDDHAITFGFTDIACVFHQNLMQLN
jgi:hypothetical protein